MLSYPDHSIQVTVIECDYKTGRYFTSSKFQSNCVGCLELPVGPHLIRLLMRSLKHLVLSCRPFPLNSLSVQRNLYDLFHFWIWIKFLIIFIEIHVLRTLHKNKTKQRETFSYPLTRSNPYKPLSHWILDFLVDIIITYNFWAFAKCEQNLKSFICNLL